MNEQPAKEWDEMDAKTQDEIKWQASVLAEIRDSTAEVKPRHGHVVVAPTGRLAHLPGI